MRPFANLTLLTLCLTFQLAQPWTIDLPEVRQYYFAKYGHVPPRNQASKTPLKGGEFIYNNYYSNSPFAEGNPGYVGPVDRHDNHGDGEDDDDHEVIKGGQYADDYEYQSYMEKKVNHIVASGARYLEGLRRAVEQYTQRLENCTSTNFTTLVASGSYQSCKEATQKSEHVRRVAQLALHTTRLLQERAYDQDPHRDPREDKALLLRLASFLDTLTHLTGFEPDPRDHLGTTALPATSSSPPPSALLAMPLSDEDKRRLMACLANQANSPEPATERCKVQLPKSIMDLYNLTDTGPAPSAPSPSTSTNGNASPGSIPTADPTTSIPRKKRSVPHPGLLSKMRPSEYQRPLVKKGFNHEPISKIVHEKKIVLKKNFKEDQKRITSQKISGQIKGPDETQDIIPEITPVEEQNPIVAFLNYYTKYKAWSNENPGFEGGHLKVEFRDDNHLQRLEKRSVDVQKKTDHSPAPQRIPEDPMQDISAYVRHRSQDYLNPDKEQADRIKKYIEGLAGQVKYIEGLGGQVKQRTRRSYRSYGSYKPYRARVPEDPLQDISYYVKYREGTEIRQDPVQAAQVRLGLEQIFQTGPLAVVQRYGSNYNPLVTDQVSAGLLRSAADA